jgi:hypothetical protein
LVSKSLQREGGQAVNAVIDDSVKNKNAPLSATPPAMPAKISSANTKLNDHEKSLRTRLKGAGIVSRDWLNVGWAPCSAFLWAFAYMDESSYEEYLCFLDRSEAYLAKFAPVN